MLMSKKHTALEPLLDLETWFISCHNISPFPSGNLQSASEDTSIFWVDNAAFTWTVKCFPNNKHWITKDFKALRSM